VKLLINADDLGYTPVINHAIFDLHSKGQLFSTSLLANMPHSQDAIDGLRSYPDLNVGVHLNLTKGRPLLPPKRIPTLVSSAGGFWPTKIFYMRAATGRINRAEVQSELRAQVERVLDFGIQPLHVDTHSHWHLLPHLNKLVTRLAKRYQIPGIRQAALRRTLIPSSFWLAAAPRQIHSHSEFRTPDYFFSLHQWMRSDGVPVDLFFSERFRSLVTRPNITLEMVTHPGALHDPEFPPDTLLTHQRQWEYDFLRSPRFGEWLEMMEAEISSYNTL